MVPGSPSILLIVLVVDVELSADAVVPAAATAAATKDTKKDHDQEGAQGDQNDSPNLDRTEAVIIIIKLNAMI